MYEKLKVIETVHHDVIPEDISLKEWSKTIKVIQPILEELNKCWWYSAGTALGFHRDKTVIAGDTDIDIEIKIEKNDDGVDTSTQLLIDMNFAKFKLVRSLTYGPHTMQLCFVNDEKIIVDYYFYYDWELENLVNFNEHGTLVFPKKFLSFRKHMPLSIEEYLVFRFGVDWNVPIKKGGSWHEGCGSALRK